MAKATNIKAERVEGEGWLAQLGEKPGAYRMDKGPSGQFAALVHSCPCGCGSIGRLNVDPRHFKPCWRFDGNPDAPTLTPSVLIRERDGTGEHWHGYLKAGVWVHC